MLPNTMEGKLIVHIGPPKTATTSIQIFLQELKVKNLCYGGINQPRTELDSSITSELYKICSHKNAKYNTKRKEEHIKDYIRSLLKIYQFLILSEEMFLLESKNISSENKLQVLFNIIKEFKPKIIFCVRNPTEALPSYYQEIFFQLPRELQRNYDLFQNSKYADCYHYRALIETLEELGFNDLHWFYFQKIIAGEYNLSDILGYDDTSLKQIPVRITKTNSRDKSNHEVAVIRKTEGRSFIRRMCDRAMIKNRRIQKKIHEHIYELLTHKKQMLTGNHVLQQFKEDLQYLEKRGKADSEC